MICVKIYDERMQIHFCHVWYFTIIRKSQEMWFPIYLNISQRRLITQFLC